MPVEWKRLGSDGLRKLSDGDKARRIGARWRMSVLRTEKESSRLWV
jgi:hypothetical protein